MKSFFRSRFSALPRLALIISVLLTSLSSLSQSYDKRFEIKINKQPSTNDPTVQIDVNLQSRFNNNTGGVNRYYYSNGRTNDASYCFVEAVFLNSGGTEIGTEQIFRYSDALNGLGQSGTFNVPGFHVDMTNSNNCASVSASGPQFQYLSRIGLVTDYSSTDGALRAINTSNVSSRRDGFGNEVSLRVTIDLSEITIPTGTSTIEFVHLVYGDTKYVNVNSSGNAVACNLDNNAYYINRSGGSATGSISGYNSDKITNIPSFTFGGGITSFSASSGDCDDVTLSIAHNFSSTSLLRTLVRRRVGSGAFTTIATRPGVPATYNDATAVPGTNYEYRVEVQHVYYGPIANSNANGNIQGPLSAPINLTATQNECGEINLSWDAVSGATGYRIFRSTTNAKPGTALTDINGSSSSYEDIITAGTYYYWVDAENTCGQFSNSTSSAQGISLTPVNTPANLTLTQQTTDAGTSVLVEWDDVSGEDDLVLEKSEFGEGTSRIILPANTTSYEDEDVVQCRLYRYRIIARNGCGESAKSPIEEFTFTPDITPIFNTQELRGSKGYFANKVELNWTFDNTFSNAFNAFKIYRRIFGSSSQPSLVNTVNSSTTIYIDDQADAGVIYEYFVIAEAQCETTVLTSHDNAVFTPTTLGVLYDVGFRAPSGTISGNVSFEGGNSVQNVKVTASRADGVLGTSAELDGNGDYISIAHDAKLNPTNGFTLSAWIHPRTLSDNAVIANKNGGGSGYECTTIHT
ncbi:MAG: hypothetical protein AAFY41_05655, partial [Bacteroidota bacterium]